MKFRFGNEGPKGVNPDRVSFEKMDHEVEETVVENEPQVHVIEAWEERQEIPSRYQVLFRKGEDLRRYGKNAFLSSLALVGAGTAALNLSEEYNSEEAGGSSRLLEGLKQTNSEALMDSTKAEVCKVVDADFMHRFTTRDEHGNEALNPGAIVVPFAVSLTEDCKTRVDVELKVPYHFARTFREIAAKNPEARQELINRLAVFIQKQVQDELVIRGVAGVTDTLLVWNKKENAIYQGKPQLDLSQFDMTGLDVTGNASAEAEHDPDPQENIIVTPSSVRVEEIPGGKGGPNSLYEQNRPNFELAKKRRNEFIDVLYPALEQAGIPVNQESVNLRAVESPIGAADIKTLANMSNVVFGETLPNRTNDLDRAYELVQEYNDGNPVVAKAFTEHPEFAEKMKSLLDNNRGVEATLTLEGENQRETVYPIALALPLLLLLLKLDKTPGGWRTIQHKRRVVERAVPDTVTRNEVGVYDAKRRLFSETTPTELQKERSFDDVYESVDIPYEDRQSMVDHILIEEVLPSLSLETQEPYIDYEAIVNKNREFLRSDARKDGIEKGSYDTTAEAERKIATDLVEMWERHDAYVYPMDGIDVKTVLNYRHSEQVVGWAKLLAPLFVQLMKETVTTTEFREKLQSAISDAIEQSSHRNRNVFVKSTL